MPTDPKPAPDRRDDFPNSPYGPQHGHVDDAAGGADSSPQETKSNREQERIAADPGQEPPGR